MTTIDRCSSTLAEGYSTYNPVALKKLFDDKRFSHIIPYHPMETDEADAAKFMENRKRISISGVQNKYSMVVDGDELRLTGKGEQGRYILKPKPADLRLPAEIPANENLTMQIAEQIFGIKTAANGLCFFLSGEAAYITRRFDVLSDGHHLRKEDFASLTGVTSNGARTDLKYQSSYEEIADLIKLYVPAWRIEMEKFYRLVLFNFIFSNGDAHLKNFSLLETRDGDFRLSPAYDLLNTHIHVDDSDFALAKGLFREPSPELLKFGTKANGASFAAFGHRIGLSEQTVARELARFTADSPASALESLIARSFLSDKTKKTYLTHYRERRNRLADMKL
ncbi:MAG: HipA domain-containing protein [Tannerellaceae bacterium]|jgi:serine/threonine-protein kinase HipA|nr:HipA domain-containing protein [Tannerellaceae bacterium]